jgi:hypothetical protein
MWQSILRFLGIAVVQAAAQKLVVPAETPKAEEKKEPAQDKK